MSLINFAQGNRENYNAQEMQDTIYLSDNSKEILFNALSYGNATPADEEDITAEDGNLKLRDRAYDVDNFSGKGYKILRKNIVEGKNVLTLEMVNEPNTVYEIRYDFDLNGGRILLKEGSTFIYCGGTINNGDVRINNANNFYLQGLLLLDFKTLNDVDCRLAIENIPSNELCFSLTSLPGYFSKYNLKGDGITDDSINFNALLKDSNFNNLIKYKNLTLILGRGYYSNHKSSNENFTFLFKNTISIGARSTNDILSLNLIIDGDIKFDWSESSTPLTLEQIINDLDKILDYNCFIINTIGDINIFVSKTRLIGDPANIRPCIINGGRDTIPGNYYEGVKTNSGKYYYSSFSNSLLFVGTANTCRINGGIWKNAYNGIATYTKNAIVENVTVTNIYGDNGISCCDEADFNNGSKDYSNSGGVTIKNCNVSYCEDLGISIQNRVGRISNCIINNCGNNNISDVSIYGINHSFNNGGGISVENYLAYNSLINELQQSVEIENCVIANCFNYAVHVDSTNVTIANCYIDNIINTSKYEYDTNRISPDVGVQFVWNLRKHGIISCSKHTDDNYPIRIINTIIDCSNQIPVALPSETVRIQFINCTLRNYLTVPENKDIYKKALFDNCKLYNWNFNLEDDYMYNNCIIGDSKNVDLLLESAYIGYEAHYNKLNNKIIWDGLDWRNEDGTLVNKVTIL